MEIVRGETIYRNRNAVQTNPATSYAMTKLERVSVSGFGHHVATIALALAVAGCAAQSPPQSTYSSGPQRVLGYVSHAEAAECDMQGQMAGATYDEVRKTCLLSKAYARQKITKQWADENYVDWSQVPADQRIE
jgi:hypothetical protein